MSGHVKKMQSVKKEEKDLLQLEQLIGGDDVENVLFIKGRMYIPPEFLISHHCGSHPVFFLKKRTL